MEILHELSVRLMDISFPSKSGDSIIRKWLSEKSKAINADANAERTVDEILGLTDVWEKPCHRGCKSGECFHLNPKQKQSWCECGRWERTPTPCFNFCPYCAKPKPTPKSLVERLAEKLNEPLLTPYGQAQISIDFLREHKEEL